MEFPVDVVPGPNRFRQCVCGSREPRVEGLYLEPVYADNTKAFVREVVGKGISRWTHALSRAGLAVVGVASTIDNDLYGSDITIGVDTALNIALEAIDRLRVTATSHRRGLLVEVMEAAPAMASLCPSE